MNRPIQLLFAAIAAALVVAACGSSAASESVNVSVAAVSVSIDSTVLTVGAQARATAIVRDAYGLPIERAVVWTSSNTSAATVSAAGLVVGVTPGTTTITATSEGKAGTATVTVVAPGSATLSGSVTDIQGNPVGGGSVEVFAGSTTVEVIPVSTAGTYSTGTLQPRAYSLRLHPPITHSLGPSEPDVRTATIVAGQRTTATFTVQAALYTDDFQSYTTATLKGGFQQSPIRAPNFWAGANQSLAGISNEALITMDPTGGVNGDKAMRYDWPARASQGCTSEITVAMQPRLYPPPTGMRDLWVRFTSKESPNFEHGRTGCGGRSYKFFLVGFESGTAGKMGRFGTYLFDGVPASTTSARLYMDFGDNQGASVATPSSLPIGGDQTWGGTYHTWVLELRGITTTSATFRVYLDGTLVGTLTNPFLAGQTLGPGWAVNFEMGANINNGPDHAQSRWWRELGIYTTRPSLLPLVPKP